MGRPTPTDRDIGIGQQVAALAAPGSTGALQLRGPGFNFAVWGTFAGAVACEVSFDGGTTWIPMARDTTGNAVTVSAPISMTLAAPEAGTLVRGTVTAITSGTANVRVSQ